MGGYLITPSGARLRFSLGGGYLRCPGDSGPISILFGLPLADLWIGAGEPQADTSIQAGAPSSAYRLEAGDSFAEMTLAAGTPRPAITITMQ